MLLYTVQLIVSRVVSMPSHRILIIIINHNHHPYTDLPIIRQQWCTMNPPIPALITAELRDPLDARGDTAPRHHGVENVVALGA